MEMSTDGRTNALSPVPWWRDAVCYEVYVRSFADADGNGVGDLTGITSRLPYLEELGVDALWLTPFYVSPQRDGGYDVGDYRRVDPLFGNLRSFDRLLASAHRRGFKLIVDVVPNHTSTEHRWFKAALAGGPNSPERRRYVFLDGLGRDGSRPPNNWKSMFGGSAWTRVSDGQWYLHLFDASQPDLNWRNPEVGDEFESILRFWLDRGVDGFRIDVAHGLFKQHGLPDAVRPRNSGPYFNQPEVHQVYRRWHRVLAEYPGERMAIGEAWVDTAEQMTLYLRHDELQQVFNFRWLDATWSAASFARFTRETLDVLRPIGAAPTWMLSNHDIERHVTRFGGGLSGLARARAATLAMLSLPGSAYLYQGEELGLPQVDVPPTARQDPTRSRRDGVGRDGCRVPLPWSGTTSPYGFSPAGSAPPWLPQPHSWRSLTVDRQDRDPSSTLNFYRAALRERRAHLVSLDQHVDVTASGGLLRLDRGEAFSCLLNCGARARRIKGYADVILTSGDASTQAQVAAGVLPPDTAAWLRRSPPEPQTPELSARGEVIAP